jgi:serine/threonine protein kinase
MVDTDPQLIQQRYLRQRLIQQGQVCKVYQGYDQVLNRAVAVKVVPAAYIATYRSAIRLTSQFAHPNIVGIYDLIIESDALYIVQEYIEGDNLNTLLQTPLTPYQVADLGLQICRALIYVGSPSRKVCHGDLTPTSVIRDRRGLVRVSNFALPSDLHYFTSWSIIGSDGRAAVADQDLPWGQQSEGRLADDTRAVGLLLYQFLTVRQSSTTIEPPADGRLRFLRNVPPELCNIIARAVIRQHPQHIATAEVLYPELKALAEALEPPIVIATEKTEGAGMLAYPGTPLPISEAIGQAEPGLAAGLPETGAVAMNAPFAASLAMPLSPNRAEKFASAGLAASSQGAAPQRRVNLPVLIGIGLLFFALFFAVGYFLANFLLQ